MGVHVVDIIKKYKMKILVFIIVQYLDDIMNTYTGTVYSDTVALNVGNRYNTGNSCFKTKNAPSKYRSAKYFKTSLPRFPILFKSDEVWKGRIIANAGELGQIFGLHHNTQ